MNVIGIVAEYNPFHNGHIFQIKKVRELYKDSIIIVVVNGYFLERGEISVLSKEEKTRICLEYGVDLVLELPFVFGSNSADIFAESAVSILNKLGVNKLIFGSESNNLDLLYESARKQLDNSFDDLVSKQMKSGFNYPTTINNLVGISIASPNDLLGVSYIKAILKNGFKIQPVTIQRTNDFHDLSLDEQVVSASNVRNRLLNGEDVSKYTPCTKFNKVNKDLLFKLLKYKIITSKDLSIYLTVDEGIENKIKKEIGKANSLDDLILRVKSKRYTYNRIQRMFMHILVGFTKEDKERLKLEYIKVLGFNVAGKKYLKSIKSDILISRKISEEFLAQRYELTASLLYDLVTLDNTYNFEVSNKPVIK